MPPLARSFRTLFLIAFLCLGAAAGIRAVPRIFTAPEPRSPQRYEHDQGDGATEEHWVLPAHQYWSQFGYAASTFLPCTVVEKEACAPYTHYPPGPFLLSSVLLKVFNNDLRPTRLVVFTMTTALAATALALLALSLNWQIATIVIVSAAIGTSRGYWLYADHLFGHGLSFSLVGLFIGLALFARHFPKRRPRIWRWYLFASFFAAWMSWEPLPTAWLAAVFAPSLAFAAVVGSIAAIQARFLQNSIELGGILNAWFDWVGITHARAIKIEGDLLSYVRSLWPSWLFQMGRPLFAASSLFGVCGLVLSPSKKSYLNTIVLVFLTAIAWNYIMIPHSRAHLWAYRHVVWPAAILLGMGLSTLLRRTFSGRTIPAE